MTLEQIYYITQIIAVIGLLVSVILVLVQLRQTQRQLEKTQLSTELANEFNVAQTVHSTFQMLVEDEQLREVVRKAMRGREPLTGKERGLYSAFVYTSTYQAQASMMAWRKGMATDELNSSHAASVSDLLNCDEGRGWLQRNETRFEPEYRALLKGLAGLGPVGAPGLPEGYPLPERHDLETGGKGAH